jgi:hypothetical protein
MKPMSVVRIRVCSFVFIYFSYRFTSLEGGYCSKGGGSEGHRTHWALHTGMPYNGMPMIPFACGAIQDRG